MLVARLSKRHRSVLSFSNVVRFSDWTNGQCQDRKIIVLANPESWCKCKLVLKSNWYFKCNDRERRRLEIQFPGKGKVDKWWWTQTDNHKRLLRCLSTTYSLPLYSVPNHCLTTSLIYHAEAQDVETDESRINIIRRSG